MPDIIYTVKAGDTLTAIAWRHGRSLQEVLAGNPEITNPNLLCVGQTIRIPAPEPQPVVSGACLVSADDLLSIAPNLTASKAAELATPLTYALRMAEADTVERQAALLAQVAHETGGFRYMRELGGESYFTRYDGRKDLGNIYPGDGARFRGRGFIQLTGRTNYERCGKSIGIDLVAQPEIAEQYGVAAMVLAWYWNINDLNRYADAGDFVGLTKRINGGTNGLEDRQRYHAQALKILST